jgi:hypothetical protein
MFLSLTTLMTIVLFAFMLGMLTSLMLVVNALVRLRGK